MRNAIIWRRFSQRWVLPWRTSEESFGETGGGLTMTRTTEKIRRMVDFKRIVLDRMDSMGCSVFAIGATRCQSSPIRWAGFCGPLG
jgi:hypothetical protein